MSEQGHDARRTPEANEARDAVRGRVAELEGQVEKLRRFKDWVHDYLDRHGVPHHPPGVHGAEGCRIGDRMDWLTGRMADLERELTGADERAAANGARAAKLEAECARLRAAIGEMCRSAEAIRNRAVPLPHGRCGHRNHHPDCCCNGEGGDR